MATSFDVQSALRRVLKNDALLDAWLQTTFFKSVTVILGNRPLKQIQPEKYPVVIIVYEPKGLDDAATGENAVLQEIYHFELGMFFVQDDVLDDTHLQHIATFESLVGKALLADRRLGGLVTLIAIDERQGDSNVNHPYHFFSLRFAVERSGEY